MKIRTDFVTNSSSVSFTVFQMDLEFRNGQQKTWGPWCAYLLKCEGERRVCGYTVNFEEMHGDLNLEELVQAESVEVFSEILYQSITGVKNSKTNGQLFTLEKNGTVWDETKFGGIDQLASVTLSAYEGDDGGEYDDFGKDYTYDFKTGTYSLNEYGEWFDAEDGTSGEIDIYTGDIKCSSHIINNAADDDDE